LYVLLLHVRHFSQPGISPYCVYSLIYSSSTVSGTERLVDLKRDATNRITACCFVSRVQAQQLRASFSYTNALIMHETRPYVSVNDAAMSWHRCLFLVPYFCIRTRLYHVRFQFHNRKHYKVVFKS